MARHRSGSRLSFRKSSSSSIPRVEATESPEEKHKYQIKGKADPSKAINEAQPADIAGTATTLGISIRELEHRDSDGNIIVDADRSNPTRPRLERPLDTIRSFEAAIDGSYNRRQSFRAETPNIMGPQNRRSSYFNGLQSQRRTPNDGASYYGDRMGTGRPDSYYENGTSPSTPYNGGGSRRFGPRNNSDPALYGNNNANIAHQGAYPSHGHQPSYETVVTGSNGSHVTDAWGNSTDPSSENSSIDRVQPAPKSEPADTYGFNGFGGGPQFQGPILEEHGLNSPGYGQPGYGQSQMSNGNANGLPYQGNGVYPSVPLHGAPMPPTKERAAPRAPIKLGANNRSDKRGDYSGMTPAAENEKRKSWIKKRFSKS